MHIFRKEVLDGHVKCRVLSTHTRLQSVRNLISVERLVCKKTAKYKTGNLVAKHCHQTESEGHGQT